MTTSLTKNSLEIYLRLLKSARKYWVFFVIGIISTILATGTDSAFSWAIKPFVDIGLVARNQTLLHWMPLVVIVAFTIRSITYFFSNYYISRVGRSIVMDYRCKIFSHLMHLPASFYDDQSSGKILSLMIYNSEQLASATTEALLTIMQEGFTLIGLIVVMFVVSWQLTLMFMLTAPLVSLIIRYNSKRLRLFSGNVQKSMGDVTHIAEEGIEGYKVVRIFGGEEYEKQKFNKVAKVNRYREMKVVVTNALGTSMVQIIASLPMAIIIYVATSSYVHITVGGFATVIAAVLRLLTPLRRLTKINTEIQKGIAGAASIFDLLDSDLEKDQGAKTLESAPKVVAYENVSFTYPKAHKEILHDISFRVMPGQTVAVVGRSGGGKSTLVSLLPRFYDVNKGKICFDGVNIQDYKLTDLRKQIAFVSQNLTLFNDTIAHNIAYGCLEKVTEDKLKQAADLAHLSEFINHLPAGMNTLIGENGLLLSGGQRQRIAIARALLKDAPILILDEATSALDTESEFYIQAALEELMKKRTTLVIAHRLSTVERADKIIVIDNGKIAEVGNHQELLIADGLYAKLYRMQFKENEHQ